VANQTVRTRRRKPHGTFAGRGAFIAETWGSGVVLQHLVLSATMRPNFGIGCLFENIFPEGMLVHAQQ
jgi:hypothetical protein